MQQYSIVSHEAFIDILIQKDNKLYCSRDIKQRDIKTIKGKIKVIGQGLELAKKLGVINGMS